MVGLVLAGLVGLGLFFVVLLFWSCFWFSVIVFCLMNRWLGWLAMRCGALLFVFLVWLLVFAYCPAACCFG